MNPSSSPYSPTFEERAALQRAIEHCIPQARGMKLVPELLKFIPRVCMIKALGHGKACVSYRNGEPGMGEYSFTEPCNDKPN